MWLPGCSLWSAKVGGRGCCLCTGYCASVCANGTSVCCRSDSTHESKGGGKQVHMGQWQAVSTGSMDEGDGAAALDQEGSTVGYVGV